ncbi:unnamed protein product [Pieris brassicae]|uniref:Uncharacterized protein n=1 Tax=Pieris brassicae TaxID=7116 RepID=A0A9P0THK0_PIEBR|nr:unnamed protein product [Pieris brassicae]
MISILCFTQKLRIWSAVYCTTVLSGSKLKALISMEKCLKLATLLGRLVTGAACAVSAALTAPRTLLRLNTRLSTPAHP